MPTVEAESPKPKTRTPRPSKMSKWRALALLLVHVGIALHILHWKSAGETLGPIEPSEGITFSQNSVISAGLVFFVVSTLATLLFGRFFCGWGCHLLALQDSCMWLMKKIGIRPKPMRSRILLIVPVIAFVYMFLYPVIYRLWFDKGIPAATTEFIVKDFWATFPPWPVAVATLLIAGFAIVYFLGSKGFCTNICPYGAAFGVADRLSPARIRVTDDCEGCGHCTQVCTSNVVVHSEVRDYGMVVDQECMKCLDCVSVCPKNALYFGFGKPALFAKASHGKKPKKASAWWKVNRWRSYSFLEELAIGALFALAFFTFRGLYNTIPFLFALAIAGILSFCALQAIRLFYKPKVQLQTLDLKAAGSITRAGKYFCGFSALLLVFWAQSAYVHYHRARAEAGYVELNELVSGWLVSPRELTPAEAQLVDETLEHVSIAEAWTPLALLPKEKWELSLTGAWLHLLKGDEASFVRLMERASAAIPGDYVACDGLANYHLAAGRTEEAEEWFAKATVAAPEEMATWSNLSGFLLSAGREKEAVEVLRHATTIEEVEVLARMMLGRFEMSRGGLPEAVEMFEAVLENEPTNLEARLNLAGILREMGDNVGSYENYEIALENGADNFEMRLNTTLSCNLAGELERAEKHARAAMLHAPDRPEPWFALRQIALSNGDEALAETYLKEAQSRIQVEQN